MPANRPRGSLGGSQHFGRNPPVTPMSERQQLALLMQMTSQEEAPQSVNVQNNTPIASRGRDRNERGETALHVAAIKGDLEQLNKLLEQGVNPNVADFAGWTPLHEACNHGWFSIAQALVKAGANVNARGLDDDTPLHDAATNGQIKLVKFLVERGADPSFKNRKGKCPCDVAAPAVYNYLMAARDSSANQCVPQTGRLRDEKKSDLKKSSEDMDTKGSTSTEDVYDFKTSKDANASGTEKNDAKETDRGADANAGSNNASEDNSSTKRGIEMTEQPAEAEDDVKRKKRKDSDSVKENSTSKTSNQNSGSRNASGKGAKPSASSNKTFTQKVSSSLERKSPCASPKPSTSTSAPAGTAKADADGEADDKASESAGFSMKVPPLKIVIPQSGNNEGDSGSTGRNGKTNSQRTHAALPYVVASNSNDSDKDTTMSQCGSPSDQTKTDEKKGANVNFSGALQEDRQNAPRVLRSSYRSGGGTGSVDRSSNNSSPQLQAAVPSPPSQQTASTSDGNGQPTTSASTVSTTNSSSTQAGSQANNEDPLAGTSSSSNSSQPQKEAPVELHPRKRKIKASKESHSSASSSTSATASSNQQDNQDSGTSEVHPHDQPVTNCYQMQLNIRKQIERRQKSLFPVQPKPPQGFKDYLMNRCTYALAGNTKEPITILPPTIPAPMKDLFTEQEHARYKLKMQHVVEKEKLVLAVEQEILRVHGRAARALANQAQPFSVCTILKDQEVYNVMTPEQEEKESSARSRYNGRLFLSWLQDVDDKWEKIKEGMLLRHQNEAESLHAVQKMDWEWQMKEHNLCDFKSQPVIDETQVPLVHVSDDFDLLRA